MNYHFLKNFKDAKVLFLKGYLKVGNPKDDPMVDHKKEKKDLLKIYESWLNQARMDLLRAERGVYSTDWD
jgi:hypothetical protein